MTFLRVLYCTTESIMVDWVVTSLRLLPKLSVLFLTRQPLLHPGLKLQSIFTAFGCATLALRTLREKSQLYSAHNHDEDDDEGLR